MITLERLHFLAIETLWQKYLMEAALRHMTTHPGYEASHDRRHPLLDTGAYQTSAPLKPRHRRTELNDLWKLATQDGAGELQPWGVNNCDEKIKQTRYDLSDEDASLLPSNAGALHTTAQSSPSMPSALILRVSVLRPQPSRRAAS